MEDDLWTLHSQHKSGKVLQISETKLFRLEIIEMRFSLFKGVLTYSDIRKRWIRKFRQGDSRLVEVGGLVGERNRIVGVGSVARNITPKRNLSVSCSF